jgi:hypothetical protein
VSTNDNSPLGPYFVRLQEYYESPEFKGRAFTLGEYRRWYAQKHGAFSYHDDWRGFNVPCGVFDVFKSGLFDPLTSQEEELINLFKDRDDKFYVIGATSDRQDVIDHEVCHGWFYVSSSYASKVVEHINYYYDSMVQQFLMHLLSMGYHADVIYDEFNAYYVTEEEPEFQGIRFHPVLRQELQDLAKSCFPDQLEGRSWTQLRKA